MRQVTSSPAQQHVIAYLPTPQGAQPPAVAAAGVLLEHGEQVPATEGQLLGGLRYVVVQGARHALWTRKLRFNG